MKQYQHPPLEQIALTEVLHALSDPVRLCVVQTLALHPGEELSCGSFDVPVAKSTMSHHIRVLRDSGVIKVRTEGTLHLLSLRLKDLETRFPGVLAAILRAV